MKLLTNYKIDRKARAWHLIDAKDQILGRMASKIAMILMGKTKPNYTPLFDSGDCVVVINAKEVKLSGVKAEQKKYYHPTGYLGNLKTKTYKDLISKKPDWVIYEAVRKMLPKTLLGKKMIKKLRVYPGAKHPHESINFVNK